ncbi:MAG: hypothetical protein E6Q98_09735 [Rhodospirillaceae bacterium]|nr:MAG: hypothetical protein E6Q98_09735 [Rhodospirillaceae bacterium]
MRAAGTASTAGGFAIGTVFAGSLATNGSGKAKDIAAGTADATARSATTATAGWSRGVRPGIARCLAPRCSTTAVSTGGKSRHTDDACRTGNSHGAKCPGGHRHANRRQRQKGRSGQEAGTLHFHVVVPNRIERHAAASFRLSNEEPHVLRDDHLRIQSLIST